MTDSDDERAALRASVVAMTREFEGEALDAIVEPLLSLQLTIQQLKVLTVLVSDPQGSTLTGLASAFGVSSASMSGTIDRLVQQGVVRRSTDGQDLRVRRVRATEQGRSAVQQLMAQRVEYEVSVIDRLADDDLRALERGMRAVRAALTTAARTPRPGAS